LSHRRWSRETFGCHFSNTVFQLEIAVFRKVILSALVLLSPSVVVAQSLSDTHHITNVPGRSTVLIRPIAPQSDSIVRCHPESGKAVGCNAYARIQQDRAMARAAEQKGTLLSER
jgi:hypothetical protein